MHRFTNILFSPLGKSDNAGAVRRVAELADRNNAKLTLLGVVAEPSRFERLLHRPEWCQAIDDAQRDEMHRRLARWADSNDGNGAEAVVEAGNQALAVIQRVLAADHDLVVVTSDEDREDTRPSSDYCASVHAQSG